ncbi:SEI2 [Linum perenne]
MLKFKSEPIRILLTMFKVVPLVAGYISESQTLRLWIRGFTEGDVPTSCLRVMIEQRAEFGPGGGIPELYDASLTLIIWGWKKTIFIWISLITFIMELLFALICCRPVILPRLRPRDASPPTVAHNPVRSNPRRRR